MVDEEFDLFGIYFLNIFVKDLSEYFFGIAGKNDLVSISTIKRTIFTTLIKTIKTLP